MVAYVMKFDAIKFDDVLMLDLLEELNLLGNRLKGTRVFLLKGNLECGACVCVFAGVGWGKEKHVKEERGKEGRGELGG